MSLELEINFSGLDSIVPDVHAFTRRAGDALGERGLELMREEEPFKTGFLRETTERRQFNVPNGYGEEIIPTAPYAVFNAFGTGIYGDTHEPIFPTQAKALRFVIGGRVLFRRSVKGQKANRFHERAFVRLQREQDAIVEREMRKVFG